MFAGLSALALAGGHAFATADDPVEVVLPAGQRWRPGPGVRVRVSSSLDDVVVDRRRLSRTGPVRTALDLIRRGPVDEGVVLLDRLATGRAGRPDRGPGRGREVPRCRGSRVARDVSGLEQYVI